MTKVVIAPAIHVGGEGSTVVIDNLASSSATAALSANQGKVLKEMIDAVDPGTGAVPAANVTQDSTHRFVTDAEKTTWNGKQNALGFTPVATTDSRLSDARTPVAHQHAMDDVTGLATALGAKADSSSLTSGLAGKVDKEAGKGLSTNDFTDDEKAKLAGLTNYDDTTLSTAVSNLETTKADADSVYSKSAADTLLAGKAAAVHTHEIAGVNGLQTALDAKAAASDVYTKTAVDSALADKANAADLVPFTGAALPGDISGYPDGKIFIID